MKMNPRQCLTSSALFSCTENSPEPYKCDSCDFKTYLKVDHHEHIKITHEQTNRLGRATFDLMEILKRYNCKNCSFQTHSWLVLMEHIYSRCTMSGGLEINNKFEKTQDHNKTKSKNDELNCEQLDTNPKSNLNVQVVEIHDPQNTNPKNNLNVQVVAIQENTESEVYLVAIPEHPENTEPEVYLVEMLEHPQNTQSEVYLLKEKKKHLKPNSVDELLRRPFLNRTFHEQLEIKSLGRPLPSVNISQGGKSKHIRFKRHFNNNIYKEESWICGCEIRNALFCFPCLLFKGDRSWSGNGVRDLAHIKDYIRRHRGNKIHITNVLNLTNIGRVNIATQLDSAYRETIKKRNEQLQKNRHILSKIIDSIKFCEAFELALHEELDTSTEVFGGLIDLMGSLDSAIKEHIESHHMLKGVSKTIQNELLNCMLDVCQEEIKKQISIATYAAIIVDDTTDISTTTQKVLVIRYEYSGKVYERFWCFLNPEEDAEAITRCILKEIRPLISTEKLIAQSYDGAAVMSGVQAKIRQVYSNARLIHCYAHQLNPIVTQCASQNKAARVFFSSLSAIPAFFSHSPLRLAALNRAVARRNPTVAPRLNFKSGVVNVVYENKDALIQCFEDLENSHFTETVQITRALRHYLEDQEFNFWLSFFHKIMPHVDILFQQVQSRQASSCQITNAVDSFVALIQKVRNATDNIAREVEESHSCTSKRPEIDPMSADARKVCDVIIAQARDRFEFVQYFDVAKLLHSAGFSANSKQFPESALKVAAEVYPTLNKIKLKTELSVVYERCDLRHMNGVLPLLGFIVDNNIEDTFEEVTKLLRILVTTPFSSGEAERCCSTSKRIKTFLRNSMLQERLDALTMLSIEKDFIRNIKDFNSKVIDKFLSCNNRRIDLIFRH